jgi:peptidoglycan hydrolase-like protein with peptidoglycan-binding domain
MKRDHRGVFLGTVLILILTLAGCELSGAAATPASVQPTAITQITTEPAAVVQATPTTEVQATPATSQPEPTSPTATATTAPAATLTPTVEACAFGASYMADITIPDDTVFAPGAAFIKTWRIKNSGTCEWEPGMKLTYVSGDPLGGPPSIDVPVTALNSPIDVSVNFVAPATPGTYRSNWRMHSPAGTPFGSTLYVQIIVPEPAPPAVVITDTPVPPNTVDWKPYAPGSTGAGVYALQYLLLAEGYTLDVDGKFGPKTEAAVKEFQTAKGILADGSVGPQTWATLVQGHTVQAGKTGEDVRAAQHLLNQAYGYGEVAVDGKFGAKTQTAVKDFQTKHGLAVDGSIGVNTWKALIGNIKVLIKLPKLP